MKKLFIFMLMLVCIVSACSKEESVDMSTEQKNQVFDRTLTKSAPVYQECGDYEFASLFQCTKAIKSDDNFTVTFYAKVHTEEQPENVFVKVYNQQTGEYFYDPMPLEAKIVGNYYIYKYKKLFRTVGTFNYKYLVQPSEKPQLYTIKKFDDIIETGTYYGPDENILQYFQHYCQRYANDNPKGTFYNNAPYDRSDNTLTVTNTCCPTCYMMAAACLAHVKYGWQTDYQVSGTKLASIVKNKELAKLVDGMPNYTRMDKFEGYGRDIDKLKTKFHQKKNLSKDERRQDMKEFLLKSLEEQKFVMVNVNVLDDKDIINDDRYYQITGNPDLYGGDGHIRTENEGTYVNNIKVIRHVILIIGITTEKNLDGIVTYIDPLAKTRERNRRYCRFSTLLNSMSISGTNGIYSALSIGLN